VTRGGLIKVIVLIFRLLRSQKCQSVDPRHIQHGRIGSVLAITRAVPEKPAIDEGPLWRRGGAVATVIAGCPNARAMMIITRRTRIDPYLPRRTICRSRCRS
jgi:hypothetical protein